MEDGLCVLQTRRRRNRSKIGRSIHQSEQRSRLDPQVRSFRRRSRDRNHNRVRLCRPSPRTMHCNTYRQVVQDRYSSDSGTGSFRCRRPSGPPSELFLEDLEYYCFSGCSNSIAPWAFSRRTTADSSFSLAYIKAVFVSLSRPLSSAPARINAPTLCSFTFYAASNSAGFT